VPHACTLVDMHTHPGLLLTCIHTQVCCAAAAVTAALASGPGVALHSSQIDSVWLGAIMSFHLEMLAATCWGLLGLPQLLAGRLHSDFQRYFGPCSLVSGRLLRHDQVQPPSQ
jgi:hypothetical protein